MSAPGRLTSILWAQALRTFLTFSGGEPATCFTEGKLPELKFMIQQRGYQPWGLFFHRQSVYDIDGGPVWHVRQQQYDILKQDTRLRSWAVRLEAGQSDWLEEREWRIVRTADVSLYQLRPIGLLVGDPTWTGAQHTYLPDAGGQPRYGYYFPPLAAGLLRFCWNPATCWFDTLAPLFPASPHP